MNIKILTSDSKNYLQRAQKIVQMYNEASTVPFDETLILGNPKRTRIITFDEDSGGILIDGFKDVPFYRVTFAAFDENNRKKGFLRACMEYAKNNEYDIPLVAINGGDEHDIWGRLGYNLIVNCGPYIYSANREVEGFDLGNVEFS